MAINVQATLGNYQSAKAYVQGLFTDPSQAAMAVADTAGMDAIYATGPLLSARMQRHKIELIGIIEASGYGQEITKYINRMFGYSYTLFSQTAASSTAMTAIAASSTAMTAIAASSTAMTAIAASSTAMTAIAASSTAMTAIINNSSALATVVASSTAMTAIAQSSVGRAAVEGSSVAIAALNAKVGAIAYTGTAASGTAVSGYCWVKEVRGGVNSGSTAWVATTWSGIFAGSVTTAASNTVSTVNKFANNLAFSTGQAMISTQTSQPYSVTYKW